MIEDDADRRETTATGDDADRRVDGRALYGLTVAILLAATLVGVALAGPPATDTPDPPPESGEFRVTDDGVRYTVHPSALQQGCPGGRDCIPSIEDPQYQSVGSGDWLAPDDLVIGVEVNGEARAYPLRILNVHEIVNDEVGGRPIAVTYCPLCRSGLVFDRRVGGSTLTFGVSGKLLNANLVMYDRETDTYWSQLNGSAIVGPQVPRTLTQVPSTITTWEEWRSGHPDSVVLSRDTGVYPTSVYGSSAYDDYEQRDDVGFDVENVDGRLHSKAIVYGIAVGDGARAYPRERVTERGVVNDEVGGLPVVLVQDHRDCGVAAFVRRIDNQTLTFELRNGTLVDGDGRRWSFDGEALAGPHEGERLDRLNSNGVYWFAWSEFHPETDVYGSEEG